LTAFGIVPDVVVALEAQIANLQDFVPFRSGNSVLACDLSSHPTVTRLFDDRLFYFCSRFAPLHFFERLAHAGLHPALFPALGSVGVAAVHAALLMARAEVFLTGLDFSFTGSCTHVRGAPNHLAMLCGSSRLRPVGQDAFQSMATRSLLRVPDKHGTLVATDRVLKSYRDNIGGVVQGSEARIMDFGPQGLDLGVRSISTGEWEEKLAVGSAADARLEIDSLGTFSRDGLREFVTQEKAILARAIESVRESAAAGLVSDNCRALLRDIDYAWVQFPDAPGPAYADRGFLSRVMVAAGHYAQRLDRISSIL
jgi:hypothetical protein